MKLREKFVVVKYVVREIESHIIGTFIGCICTVLLKNRGV